MNFNFQIPPAFRAVLDKLPNAEKYLRIAPYLRCGEVFTTVNGTVRYYRTL